MVDRPLDTREAASSKLAWFMFKARVAEWLRRQFKVLVLPGARVQVPSRAMFGELAQLAARIFSIDEVTSSILVLSTVSLAQLVARVLHTYEVAGSIPVGNTTSQWCSGLACLPPKQLVEGSIPSWDSFLLLQDSII